MPDTMTARIARVDGLQTTKLTRKRVAETHPVYPTFGRRFPKPVLPLKPVLRGVPASPGTEMVCYEGPEGRGPDSGAARVAQIAS